MTTTTTLDLDVIKARADAVPKGPWVIEGDYPQSVTNAEALVIAECFEGPQWPPSIAEFIAHAREDVPALVAEVERLRTALANRDLLLDKHRETTGVVVRQRAEAQAERDALREENARWRQQAAASKVSEDILQGNINALVAERDA